MSKKISPLMTSNCDNWKTPKLLYDFIVKQNNFVDLFEYCSFSDQYETMYYNNRLYINPPFSHLNTKKFEDYILKLLYNGNKILLLIPSRTDTKIFHTLLANCDSIYFFKGRLHFNDSKKASTFPSCLMVLSANNKRIFTQLEHGTLDYFVNNVSIIF